MEASDTPAQSASSNGTTAQEGCHQLPKQLESITAAMEFPPFRHRWNTNEEIASLLIAFERHPHWQQHEIKLRPPSGSLLFYSRNKVRYRKDGYCWKKRKDGKTIREDHMKLKVQGLECIYGSYVHSAILPTFHRRCYWLLQNPDIVLLHYLNVPYPNSTKLTIPIVSFAMEKKEWTKDELFDQLHPMFSSCQGDRKPAVDEVVSALVQRLIDHQDQRNTSHKCDAECDKNCLHSTSVMTGGGEGNMLSVLGAQAPTPTQSYTPSQGVTPHTPFIVNLVNVSTSSLMLVSSQTTSQLSNMANGASSCSSQSAMARLPGGHSQTCALQVRGEVMGSADSVPCTPLPCLESVKSEGSQSGTPTQLLSHDMQGIQLSEQTYYSQDPVLPSNQKHSSAPLCLNNTIPMQLATDSVIGGTDSVDNSQMGAFNFDILSTDKVNSAECSASQDLGDSLDLSSLKGSDLNLDHIDLLDFPDLEKLCCDMLGTNPQDAVSISSPSLETKNLLSSSQCLQDDSAQLKPDNIRVHCTSGHGSPSSQCSVIPTVPPGDLVQGYSSGAGNSPSPGKEAAIITDFSPDWAYSEGQCKVLVTGPWYSKNSTYTILIAGKVIGTTLVQPGVLRCFVPAHPPGLVTLQVSCDRVIISNTVVFEYRARSRPSDGTNTCKCRDWFSLSDAELQVQLLNKLDVLHGLLKTGLEAVQSGIKAVPDTAALRQKLLNCESLGMVDMCLVNHLDSLSSCVWSLDDMAAPDGYMGLSLLHMAAGLGCHRFISALIRWRTDMPSCFLEYEVDAHSVDDNSCSPLMWACAKGHREAAVTLYNWNKASLSTLNKEGNQALLVARQHGHHQLADHMTQLSGSQPQNTDISHYSGSQLSPDFLPSTRESSGSQLAATSTPITKETPTPIFKSPQNFPVSNNTQSLGSLHIDIPATPTSHKDKISRRQSEQVMKVSQNSSRQKLKKRLSVDLLPSDSDQRNQSQNSSFQRPIREANSEPHLSVTMEHMTGDYNPMLCDPGHDLSPDMLIDGLTSTQDRLGLEGVGSLDQGDQGHVTGQVPVRMDTDENHSNRSTSPFIDVEKVSSDEDDLDQAVLSDRQTGADGSEDSNHQMVHLAKQIIAAIPERIKSSPSRCVGDQIAIEVSERERSSSYSSLQSHSPHASSYGDDSGISTPMRDSLAFDEYRYSDLGTPASSLSPDSTCLHSPYSPYGFQLDSPPPTTADFTEYFNAPATFMEKDFSQLTLSDREQRKLYEAAKVIQSAYRTYRDKQCQQQRKEIEAAVLIQSYYRRYKQYAYYKKMTQAAVLIQSQFRSYYAQKRFKKSRDAAVVIQNQYRSYKEHERLKKGGNKSVVQRYRSHYQRKLLGGAGAEKGSRVVQMVPDGGDGCPQETSTTTDDCPPDTDEEEEEEEEVTDEQTHKSCDQKQE